MHKLNIIINSIFSKYFHYENQLTRTLSVTGNVPIEYSNLEAWYSANVLVSNWFQKCNKNWKQQNRTFRIALRRLYFTTEVYPHRIFRYRQFYLNKLINKYPFLTIRAIFSHSFLLYKQPNNIKSVNLQQLIFPAN